jgi:ribonuclease P protein component
MIAKQLRLNRKRFIEVRRTGVVHRNNKLQIYVLEKSKGMAVVISNKNNPSAVWRNTIRRYFYDTLKDYAAKQGFVIYFYIRIHEQNYKDVCSEVATLLSKVPFV